MPLAYLDCFAGLSGDMFLGALVDLGWPVDELRRVARELVGDAVRIEHAREQRHGITGVRVRVIPTHGHPHGHHHGDHHDHAHEHGHRGLVEIREIIGSSGLEEPIVRDAIRVFERLGEAEAAIHDVPLEEVHFHEVGALDAIVDIVGAVAGIHALGLHPIVCAPPVVGHGTTRSMHGTIPLPAPATARLLRGLPLRSAPMPGERTTPTGAALAVTLASSFGAMPDMRIDAIGYGVATADPPELANVLRVLVGEAETAADDATEGLERDRVDVVETEVDDMNPELYGYLDERLRAAGAHEVILTPVHMKKQRPGTAVRAIGPAGLGPALARCLLTESTTTGVRLSTVERLKQPRQVREMPTPFGPVRVKVIGAGDARRLHPEYEDLRALAARTGRPLPEIERLVLAALSDDDA